MTAVEGDFKRELAEDPFRTQLAEGRQGRYTISTIKTLKRQAPRVKLNFLAALWPEVGRWWSKLTWSSRSENRGNLGRHNHEVTWLELVIDFELTTGFFCMLDEPETPIGDEEK